MQLARMPSRPWYTAVVLVSMCSAPLAIPYGTLTAMPAVRPSIDDHVDDRSAAGRRHVRDGMLAGVDGALEIDVEAALQSRFVEAAHRTAGAGAAVVDQHVQVAVALDRGGDHGRALFALRHVGGERRRLPARGADLRHGALRVVGVQVGDQHPGALARQRYRGGASGAQFGPFARAAAGDDGHLAGQPAISLVRFHCHPSMPDSHRFG